MTDLRELLDRAKDGSVTKAEVDDVARQLSASVPSEAYTMLHIVGRFGDRSYRGLVESFLDYRDDPLLARLALQIVCGFWGETKRYQDRLHKFIRGVDWDAEGYVRLIAISSGGRHVKATQDREMLRAILDVYLDRNERSLVRQAAYCALATACGRSWRDLPPASRHFDPDKEADPAVLQEVQAKLR